MTHQEHVIQHLEKFGSITQREATELYSDTRLADTVFKLKKKGFPVVKEMVDGVNKFGASTRYARYSLEVQG